MTLTERVTKTLEEISQERNNDSEFTKLREFYENMLRLGIAQKPMYTLPQADTIGRRLCQIASPKN